MFTLTDDEWAALNRMGPPMMRNPGAVSVSVLCRTDPDFVREVLPPPLRPTEEPLLQVGLTHGSSTSLGYELHEGVVAVRASHRGEQGWYPLSIPIDDDNALIDGREVWAQPKQLAESMSLTRDGQTVVASAVKRGTEVLHIEVELTDPVDPAELGEPTVDLDGNRAYKDVAYFFTWSLRPDGDGLLYMPRLIRQVVLNRPRGQLLGGIGKVSLDSSPCDALGDVPVRDIVSSKYGEVDSTILPGRMVRRVWNVRSFLRRAMVREGGLAVALDRGLITAMDAREEKRLRRAIRRY